jgi:hypothetical protein
MKKYIWILAVLAVLALPALFIFMPDKHRDFELMDYDFDLSTLVNSSISDPETFSKFVASNPEGFPEGFVTWDDVAFLGDIVCFRPNEMVNFPYEYYYHIDDRDQPSVRYRLHVCHGKPANSNYEFLFGEHVVLTKEQAFQEGKTIVTFAKPYRENASMYFKIERGQATYMYAPNGKLSYIYWHIGDLLYVLYGMGDYKDQPGDALMDRLLSMDDAVAEQAMKEIITALTNR